MPGTSKLPLIVVVEDSDEDFETAKEAVQRAGIAVEIRRATTGDACLQLLRDVAVFRPAMVLMDLNTPGTDGREALAAIKKDDALKVWPVVVFTTSADPRDLNFCYAAGANAYHVKPVRYPEHLQLVAELLTYWLGRVVMPLPKGGQP